MVWTKCTECGKEMYVDRKVEGNELVLYSKDGTHEWRIMIDTIPRKAKWLLT